MKELFIPSADHRFSRRGGVAPMSIERISWLALIGYLAGAGIYITLI